ncbi:MAG: AIPR family protein [Gaiellaceae bacterium]
MAQVTIQDLSRELREWERRFPRLRADALFVAWFLRAYVTDEDQTAVDALTGRAGDKGVDAVLVDDKIKAVFLVQGKLRESLMKSGEKREDVLGFAQLAHVIHGDDDEWETYVTKLAPDARHCLEDARERLLDRAYRLHLCFVTTGRVSAPLVQEARRRARTASTPADHPPGFAALDGREVMALLGEYLDGVAPPVPSLDMSVEGGQASSRFDQETGIRSWVVTMTGEDVGKLYRQAGVRLFARNIRGYLGDTKINREMQRTIKKDPQNFWYLNNGVTIVCNEARFEQEGGRELLNLAYPQVINGQQTTRTLANANPRDSAKARVSVRVISIPRHSAEQYERLVSQIVRATNWQNVIKPSDLMSNDPRQIELEREFRKLNYLYVRKRQVQAEARRVSFQYQMMITKEALANAFAACLEESLPKRVGLQPLFEDHYDRIFGGRRYSAKHYLCCYWHYKKVESLAWGISDRRQAKFVVTYFLWQQFGSDIRASEDEFLAFCEAPQWYPRLTEEYHRLLRLTFDSVLRYYRKERGTGRQTVEVTPFFKRTDVYKGYEAFWPSAVNATLRTRFDKSADRFRDLLKNPA